MMSSSNKKIIIVGATSGIGREVAKIYLERGNTVGITGRRMSLLQEIKSPYPGKIHISCFDVRGENNISQLQSLISELGGMDLLIYNSGFGDVSKSLDWELDKATYETNVKGFVEIMNFSFNYFLLQGNGHLAVTSSIAALRGNSWAPAYSASKAFQSIYMEGLYMKSKKMKANIFVTDIQPGFVDTKMAKGNGQFWVAPVAKAARQIVESIDKKKWKAYVTRRWWFVAQVMKWAPGWLYHKIG
ncbi:MAG TPA: SDR family NAD(P)-dependent oxidoreductase [Chitinophagaceae bacterium]|nr:SDR family NAD(P)-dependent oxidoreductase [Chitinophagaceae bacterium]